MKRFSVLKKNLGKWEYALSKKDVCLEYVMNNSISVRMSVCLVVENNLS